jgi:multiple sugar transport system ATP-binding protein
LVLGLRPERVTLGGASQNSIQARVELVEPTGLGTVVHFESATQSLKMFTTGRPVLEAGETAPISVKTEDIRLFHPDSGARRFRAA